MSRWRPGILLAAVGAASCLDPTQATVEITTNVPCGAETPTAGALLEVGLLAGAPDDARTGELQGTTRQCTPGDGTHRIGDVVVYPTDGADEARLLVVAGLDDATAETCLEAARRGAAEFPASCIVARRQLSFVAQADLQIPVLLDSACAGIACADDTTCTRRGGATTCVSAEVACRGGACSIAGDGGGGGASGTTTSTGGAGGPATGGGGGAGGAGGGGAVPTAIEEVPVDGEVVRVTGMTGAAGETGDLFVVVQGPAEATILRLDPATPVQTDLGGQVIGLDARLYPAQEEQILIVTPGAVILAPELQEPVDLATDAALLRGNRVLVADGTSRLLLVSATQTDALTLDRAASVTDTYDGVIAAAAGDGVCWVTPGLDLCVDLENAVEPAVSVAAGPNASGGLDALAVTAGGAVALVSFVRDGEGLDVSTEVLTPPTQGATLIRGRVTVAGNTVNGAWIAGSRNGAAFLARGVREEGVMTWTTIDAIADEPPLVDLWVAPTEGDRAWVVTADGRLLAITLG